MGIVTEVLPNIYNCVEYAEGCIVIFETGGPVLCDLSFRKPSSTPRVSRFETMLEPNSIASDLYSSLRLSAF